MIKPPLLDPVQFMRGYAEALTHLKAVNRYVRCHSTASFRQDEVEDWQYARWKPKTNSVGQYNKMFDFDFRSSKIDDREESLHF